MTSLSSGINSALQAVLSQTQVMEVIEQNVANANTKGYHKQSAVLSATSANPSMPTYFGFGAGQLGSGVTVESIQRFTVDYFDQKYRAVSAQSSSSTYQSEILSEMESISSDLADSGLTTIMDNFWSSWQDIAADPTNTNLQTNVISNASSLATVLKNNAQQLTSLQQDQNQAIIDRVDQVNSLAKTIAELNGQITQAISINQQPNDLLDQRDAALDQLADLTGAVSYAQSTGQMVVSIGGHMLVNGTSSYALKVETDPAKTDVNHIVWADNGSELKTTGGEIEGILKVRDDYIENQLTVLNDIASTLITQVNNLHTNGFTQDGDPGGTFFTGTDATNIGVSDTLATDGLAISSVKGETANGDVAQQIYDLSTQKIMNGNTQTLGDYYNAKITDLALTTSTMKTNSSQNSTVLSALNTQRQSITGVSLDEEATNLSLAQKAYQAASRVMTAFDQLFDVVINQMGLVGRG